MENKFIKLIKNKDFDEVKYSLLFGWPLMLATLEHIIGKHNFFGVVTSWQVQLISATILILLIGVEKAKKSYVKLKAKIYVHDQLQTLATSLAYAYSIIVLIIQLVNHAHHIEGLYFDCLGLIYFIFGIAEYIDAISEGEAQKDFSAINKLYSKYATILLEDGSTKQILSDDVEVNDILVIKKGEKIPVDGIVSNGYSQIDNSIVTGEQVYHDVKVDDKVISGTINMGNTIQIKATHDLEGSFVSQLVDEVDKVRADKLPIQEFGSLLIKWFLIFIAIVAGLTFIGWMLFTKLDWYRSFGPTITVLLITCPCGIALGVPMATMLFLGRASKEGIVIKDKKIIEKSQSIKVAAFDKTGTLTSSVLEVSQVSGDEQAKSLMLTLEQASTHPLAESLVKYLSDAGVKVMDNVNVNEVVSRGLTTKLDNKQYYLGSFQWIKDINEALANKYQEQYQEFSKAGKIVVWLFDQEQVLGYAQYESSIKPGAKEMIAKFQAQGIKTVMITGDNEYVAQDVANKLNINEVHAGQTPSSKLAIINDFEDKEEHVLYVGDGINDSISLEKASMSISFADASQISINSADALVTGEDVNKIYVIYQLANFTKKMIYYNFSIAIIYNLIVLPVGIFGLILPQAAPLGEIISSVSVALNTLRIRSRKIK